MSHHVLVMPFTIRRIIDAMFMDVLDQNLLMDGKHGPKRVSGYQKRVKLDKVATAKTLNVTSAISNNMQSKKISIAACIVDITLL